MFIKRILNYISNRIFQIIIKVLFNSKNKGLYDETALHRMTYLGSIEDLELLIEFGANIEDQDIQGWTVLHHAAYHGRIEFVELLIKSGANIEARDREGATALHKAAREGQIEVVELLIDSGANIETQNNFGSTALHHAAGSEQIEVVKLLIKSGANIEAQNHQGGTVLHYASHNKKIKVIKFLIDSGVNIEALDNSGLTALHHAARNGKIEVVKFLIYSGANMEAQNNSGSTALDEAILFLAENSNTDQAPYLQVINYFKSVDIGRKAFKHIALTDEELTFKQSENYSTDYFDMLTQDFKRINKAISILIEHTNIIKKSNQDIEYHIFGYLTKKDSHELIKMIHPPKAATNSEPSLLEMIIPPEEAVNSESTFLEMIPPPEEAAKQDGNIPQLYGFNEGLKHGIIANSLIRCAIDYANGKTEKGFYQCAGDGIEKTLAYSSFFKESDLKSIIGPGPVSAIAWKIFIDTAIDKSEFTVEYALELVKYIAVSFSSVALPAIFLNYKVITDPYFLGMMVQTSPIILEPGVEILKHYMLDVPYDYFMGENSSPPQFIE